MKHLIQRPASRRRTTLASSITHILTGGTLLLVGAVASTSAFAQEKATNLDRITVTGSNIPRTNTETPSPVQVVTRQEIDRTGKTTVAEYLQTITANGAGSIPKSFGNGFAGGGAVHHGVAHDDVLAGHAAELEAWAGELAATADRPRQPQS